ncbi:hypothetical protein [Tsuneonella rigui]|uniref:hypothetical protein n=1 Tax=Tsuneonella rigui TaxID=1708790 RepID=UPI0013DED98A|nr:hypothetical protein [Tsuneonella rigui]
MIAMESANCRNYRGHIVIARKITFGRYRFDVWRQGEHFGRFRDDIAAELHVDKLLRGD